MGSLARIHTKRERRRRQLSWAALAVVALAIVGIAVGHATKKGPSSPKPTSTIGTTHSTVTSGTTHVTGGTVTNGATTTQSALVEHSVLHIPAASAMAEGGGSAFVTDDVRNLLVRFDPTTKKVEQTLQLAGRPSDVLFAGTDLWVAEIVNNVVVEVDPTTLHVIETVQVPDEPTSLAALGNDVWVTSLAANEVTPIDTVTGLVGTPVQVLSGAVRLASGFGAIWVTGTDDILTRIVPAQDGQGPPAQHAITVGKGPIGVTTGGGFVWVANAEAGTVSQIDPTTLQVAQTLPAGQDPIAVAITPDDRVYAGFATSQTVRIVSPAPESKALGLDGAPRYLLTVGSGVWVATANPGGIVSVG